MSNRQELIENVDWQEVLFNGLRAVHECDDSYDGYVRADADTLEKVAGVFLLAAARNMAAQLTDSGACRIDRGPLAMSKWRDEEGKTIVPS